MHVFSCTRIPTEYNITEVPKCKHCKRIFCLNLYLQLTLKTRISWSLTGSFAYAACCTIDMRRITSTFFFFLNEMLLLFLSRSIIWYKGRKIKANTIKCVTCSSAPSYQITTRIKTAFLKGSNTLWNPVKFLSHILQSWSGCFLDLALLCWDTHLPTYSLGELWRHLPQC